MKTNTTLYPHILKRCLLFCLMCIYFPLFSLKPKNGIYRGVLYLDSFQNIQLPFNFEVSVKGKKTKIAISNAEEKIEVNEIRQKGDSLFFKMPVFDTEFRCKIGENEWSGFWVNHYRKDKHKIPFKAFYNQPNRFLFKPGAQNPVFEGRWETVFSPGSKDSSIAIGVFHHLEQSDDVTGTFLTETGDYRYLEGMKHGDSLYLSCFDGSHAFLFTAKCENDKLTGMFYSGSHWNEKWIAVKNEHAALRDPNSITQLAKSDKPISFSFKDTKGKTVSLSDEAFKNKAVIIQLMGSWCPNCMDESKYLSGVYNTYQSQGLEIVALAFERTEEFDKAALQVERMKTRLGMNYPVLITQKTGKAKASETFPQLNNVSAFPTTIFLNKKQEVVKIHTGFNGPATGKAYQDFTKEIESLIQQLIKE
jgi:thiol-disulfide isomerase/thioredoxin